MVIEAGAFTVVPTAAAFALERDNGTLLSLAFLLPLAKTDRETQTHRFVKRDNLVGPATARSSGASRTAVKCCRFRLIGFAATTDSRDPR